MTLAAVVFDLDATLVDHVGAATAGLRSWAGDLGVDVDDGFVAAWFAAEQRHFARWREGEVSHDEQRRERLREVLPLLKLPVGEPEDLDGQFAGFLAAFREHWRAFEEAREVLLAVRAAGLATAVLTNGLEGMQRDKLRRTGLADLAGPVFTAEGTGVPKPRPEAFAAVCDGLGLPPERVLHVGDEHEVDVLGARAAGLQAVLVDRTGSAPPQERAVVGDLRGLLPLLGVAADGGQDETSPARVSTASSTA